MENGGGIEESAGESECVCVHDSVSIWDMITFVGDDRMRYIETLGGTMLGDWQRRRAARS